MKIKKGQGLSGLFPVPDLSAHAKKKVLVGAGIGVTITLFLPLAAQNPFVQGVGEWLGYSGVVAGSLSSYVVAKYRTGTVKKVIGVGVGMMLSVSALFSSVAYMEPSSLSGHLGQALALMNFNILNANPYFNENMGFLIPLIATIGLMEWGGGWASKLASSAKSFLFCENQKKVERKQDNISAGAATVGTPIKDKSPLGKALASYGVNASVVSEMNGASVTRFLVDLPSGTKSKQIENILPDISREMGMNEDKGGITYHPSMNGYAAFDIPNNERRTVYFKDLMNSSEFRSNQFDLPVIMGEGIDGKPIVVDMAKTPHLLVAGTTGSGKSVFTNGVLISLLYGMKPEDLRVLIIDPKGNEFFDYKGMPQLLNDNQPVTDMDQAYQLVSGMVDEMELRYKLMEELGVRNIKGLNKKIEDARKSGSPIINPFFDYDKSENNHPRLLDKLPRVAIVADEFADLMATNKESEELVVRLAQKARAAGIHLFLATQRPSVDVVTGLIKGNMPTRISFLTNSQVDSRTILDQVGAERLLDNGDGLFSPAGSSKPIRFQAGLLEDEDIEELTNVLKSAQ